MNDYVLLRFSNDDRVLVLGMRWHTILGSRLDLRARQKAKQTKASHYAHASHSEAVGVVKLGRADRKEAELFHSGALAFAAEHPHGVVALRAALPDGRVWVVAAQSGKVLTNSDRIYATAEQALAAIDELAARHGDALTVLEALDLDSPAMPFAALMSESSAECRLRSCGWALPGIPRPVAVAVLGCAAAFLLRAVWDWHASRSGRAVEPLAVDPEAAWSQAWEAFRSRVRVDAEHDWGALFDRLVDLPVEIGGWRLASAQCKRDAVRGWSCWAKYGRIHRLATNASFLASRPKGWSEAWQPMDGVVARFDVSVTGRPLDVSRLKTSAEHESETISSLQRLLPLLSAASLGEAAPVRVEAPRDERGVPLPVPSSLPALVERTVTLEGPLRSMFLLPGTLAGQVEWRSVALSVDPSVEPALNRSQLMAGISGVLYAHE